MNGQSHGLSVTTHALKPPMERAPQRPGTLRLIEVFVNNHQKLSRTFGEPCQGGSRGGLAEAQYTDFLISGPGRWESITRQTLDDDGCAGLMAIPSTSLVVGLHWAPGPKSSGHGTRQDFWLHHRTGCAVAGR